MSENLIQIPKVLLLCLIIFFTSCEKDEFKESDIVTTQGIKSRKVSLQELPDKAEIINQLDLSKKEIRFIDNISENRELIDTEYGFKIDIDKALLIEYGDLYSITFPIHRDEETDVLENLVICVLNDGTFSRKILKYNLTEQEKIDLVNNNLKTIQNPIETINLRSSSGCQTTTIEIIVSCSSGEHNAGNMSDWHNCTASIKPRVLTLSYEICEGGIGSLFSQLDGYNFPANYPTNNTNPSQYEGGISQPVISDDFENQLNINKTPCDILKEQVDNNPIFDNKLDSLKQRVSVNNTFNDTHETTITVKRVLDSLIYSVSNSSNASNGVINGTGTMTNKDVACIHNHPANTIPIFSHVDIVDFFDSYNYVLNSRKNEFTSYLVCFNGETYALRMENIIALSQLFNGLDLNTKQGRADAEDRVLKIFQKHGQNINQSYNQSMAEELFLKVLNDPKMGNGGSVNVYRRDGNGWGKLKLIGNTIQKENCN